MPRISNGLRLMCAAAAIALAAIPDALAQMRCGDRSDVVEWLEEQFDEKPHGFGLVAQHTVIELHVSERGTWTILSTSLTGRSCMISAGHAWTDIPVELDGVDASITRR